MIFFEHDGMYCCALDHWDFNHHLLTTFKPTSDAAPRLRRLPMEHITSFFGFLLGDPLDHAGVAIMHNFAVHFSRIKLSR
ncbi:uncharacterized protein HD556DRAFT_1437583 [Suillus plorans]|uniref:Uncharacterized protein n=1 Tax=Suillus plorans TaxID=116603 RepID=A0A9P7J5M9_9AGAM|nr:uncharacterized protein HD556DRAFT_1437583 [Suillus plorans]KAG1803846.1 hypothetical protein HD556DRAFT_1437583 [Suillus plorans]